MSILSEFKQQGHEDSPEFFALFYGSHFLFFRNQFIFLEEQKFASFSNFL